MRLSNTGAGTLSGDFSFAVGGSYSLSVVYETQDADGNIALSYSVGSPVFISIVAGDVSPERSTATWTGGPFPFVSTVRPAVAGEFSEVRIVPRDVLSNENRDANLDDRISIRITSRNDGSQTVFGNMCATCNTTCKPGAVKRGLEGAYIASYSTIAAGIYDMFIEIDGIGINGFPISIDEGSER
eukprot:SAG31_NODE_4847_length_2907_cov_1.834402_2_plen_185_part_00